MGTPAAVAGDPVLGTCVGHLVPGPGGAAVPAPAPLPFSAPLLENVATSVFIGGKAVVLVGSGGVNTNTPHVGLHPTDPVAVAVLQRTSVLVGSSTVLVENRGMASTGARAQLCIAPAGTVQGSAADVLVGGGPGG